jgi:hypothetical protein
MTSSPTWNSLGKPQILDVALRLGRVQAEQGVVPLPSFVRTLREVFDGDQPSVRSRELPDDPTVDDLVGHRSKKDGLTVALPRLHRLMLAPTCSSVPVPGQAQTASQLRHDSDSPIFGVDRGSTRHIHEDAGYARPSCLASRARVRVPAYCALRNTPALRPIARHLASAVGSRSLNQV